MRPSCLATRAVLSRRTGWHPAHRVALAAGALLTYAWAGFLITALKHGGDPVAFAGNGVFAVAAMVLGGVAARISARPGPADRSFRPPDASQPRPGSPAHR